MGASATSLCACMALTALFDAAFAASVFVKYLIFLLVVLSLWTWQIESVRCSSGGCPNREMPTFAEYVRLNAFLLCICSLRRFRLVR